MGKRQLSKLVLMSASLAVLVPHSVAACGFGDSGLSRAQVEEIVKATLTGVPQPQAGIWVTHEDVNPATGEFENKHFWLVEHDGLVFGSGWHHDESGG